MSNVLIALRPGTRFVIALLAVAAICPLLAQSNSSQPSVLRQFLASRPDLRIVSMSDAPDVFKDVEQYFLPFVEADLAGDSLPEVAAVVVQTAARPRYGVVVLHRSQAYWAVHSRTKKS